MQDPLPFTSYPSFMQTLIFILTLNTCNSWTRVTLDPLDTTRNNKKQKSTCHNGSTTALLIFYQILLYLADKCLQKYHVTLFCEQLILLVYFTMELHFTTYIKYYEYVFFYLILSLSVAFI